MLKIFIKKLINIFLHILWICPIRRKTLLFVSFQGSSITCNPYYIFRELASQKKDYKYIWCCNKPELFNLVQTENVHFVKFNSFKYIIALLTSKVIVNNGGCPSWVPFRKKQIVINTWHGGGAYKKAAADELKTADVIAKEKQTARNTTHFISSSEIFTKVMTKATFVSEDKFLPIGMPRNDIFFNQKEMESVNSRLRKEYGLSANDYVVLFAPTYRGSSQKKSVYENNLDIGKLKITLKKKFNKNVKIIFRGHVFFTANQSSIENFDIDVSSYPNMQELLCMVDMLITDYSSSMWDMSLSYRPCFLFTPDIEQYISDRGFYSEPEKWGFPIAKTNDELSQKIINFNFDDYKKAVTENHKFFNSYENGTASKEMVKIIISEIELD